MGTMRQTVTSIALVAIAGVHETKASPIDYQLQLYNIDDDMSVTISDGSGVTYSNSFPFNTSTTFDITSDLSAGINTIDLSLTNTASGYTYGFALYENDVQVLNAYCGVFNTTGCNGDSYQSGNVVTSDIVFDGDSGLISLASVTLTPPAINRISISPDTTPVLIVNPAYTVPEPSTWAMMLMGFVGLGFAGFRVSRRSAVLAS
jgi:hypothetical protein